MVCYGKCYKEEENVGLLMGNWQYEKCFCSYLNPSPLNPTLDSWRSWAWNYRDLAFITIRVVCVDSGKGF